MKAKNTILSLSLLLTTLLISSCNGSGDGKIALYYVDKSLSDVVTLSDDGQLASLVESKSNFVIAVPGNDHCSCWSGFHNGVLIPYIKDTGVTIYSMALSTFKDEDYGIDLRDDRPTLAIFHYGKLVYNRVYSESDYIFSHIQYFTDWFTQVVNIPKIIKISKEELESFYHGSTPFNVYFGRSDCPDCEYFAKNDLANYIESKSPSKTIYYIDLNVQGIMLDNSLEVDKTQYQEFKDTFGMSTVNNPIFGYNGGYVPTLIYVEPNGELPTAANQVIKSGIVIYNDSISKNKENKYIVSSSYFTSTREASLTYLSSFNGTKVLQNLVLQDSQVTDYGEFIKWNYDNATTYFRPLVYAYLDSYYL